MAGDTLIAALGDQIGMLTVELTKRDVLLREAREQTAYLREQLGARDAPTRAESGS